MSEGTHDVVARDWVIRKSGYFYRPNRCGYTLDINQAGLYSEAEARAEASVEPASMSAHPAVEFERGPSAGSVLEQRLSALSTDNKRLREALEEIKLHLNAYHRSRWPKPIHEMEAIARAALSPATEK